MKDTIEATMKVNSQAKRAAILWSILIVILIVAVAISIGFFGYYPLSVYGDSMEPALRDGDGLLAKDVDPAKVRVGDIVVLQHQSMGPVAHRVIRIESLSQGDFLFQTKGDASQAFEWWVVSTNEKVGIVLARVRFVGRALEFSQTLPGMILLSVSALALVVVLNKLLQIWRFDRGE